MARTIDLDELPRIGVLGTGSAVPPNILTNSDLEKLVDTSDEWIKERTGMKEKRISTKDEPLPVLGAVGGKQALGNTHLGQIKFLIFATNKTTKYSVPDTACMTQYLLGADNAFAIDIGGGCSGGIFGEYFAYNFLKTELMKKLEKNPFFLKTAEYQDFLRNTQVLLLAGDTLSNVVDYTDRNTCVLLSDGLGAARIGFLNSDEAKQNNLGYLSFFQKSKGEKGGLLNWRTGFTPQFQLVDGKLEYIGRGAGDNNNHYFIMDGASIFKEAVPMMVEAFKATINDAGIDVESKEFKELVLNPHQANMRIMQGVVKRLQIDISNVYVDGVRKYSNNSLATYMIGQDELFQQGRLWKGRLQSKVAFGGGLSGAGSLIRWSMDKPDPKDIMTCEKKYEFMKEMNDKYSSWENKFCMGTK